MTNHSELLNLIAKKIKAKIYIEIGVFNPEHNFNKIEVEEKIGVDPDPNAGATACMTSDNFFSFFKKIGGHADLVWIDGLHHADQVKKDIENAWEILSPGGVIAIHDCNPHKESITHVPRDSREWCGDVFKVICNLWVPKFTVDFDYGCCVIRKGNSLGQEYYVDPFPVGEIHNIISLKGNISKEEAEQINKEMVQTYTGAGKRGRVVVIASEESIISTGEGEANNISIFNESNISWEMFDQNRKELLNLKTVEESVEIIEAWT
jgi:predicted DNA-binding protein with PD1-like motif